MWHWAGRQSPPRVVVHVLPANHPGSPVSASKGGVGAKGRLYVEQLAAGKGGGGSEVRPSRKHQEPLESGGMSGPALPQRQDPGRRGPRKRQSRFPVGALGRGEASPACPEDPSRS